MPNSFKSENKEAHTEITKSVAKGNAQMGCFSHWACGEPNRPGSDVSRALKRLSSSSIGQGELDLI